MAYRPQALSPDIETLVLHETQKGPYIVPLEQLRTQLLQARARLRPKTYGRVTSIHIMWDEPQSKHLEAGCQELGEVFSEYGYKSEQVRLDPTLDVSEMWRVFLKIRQTIAAAHNANDMVIIHYRGRTEYAEDNHGLPILFLRSASSKGLSGEVKTHSCPGVVWFSTMYDMLHGYNKAHVVYLMDSDYSSRESAYGHTQHPLYDCNPVLAAVSGRPGYGTGHDSDVFTDSIIKHLRKALHNQSFYSLSTLICVMHLDGLKPFATRACFEKYSSLNADRVSPSFTPVFADADKSASISMVQPAQALGTVLVKIRVSSGGAEDAERMSQTVSALNKWLLTEFHQSSANGSCPTTFAALVKSHKDPACVQMEMSRALWHCMPPYRGWAEIVDGVEEAEGVCHYFGEDSARVFTSMFLPHTATWDSESATNSEYDDSEDMSFSLFD